MHYRIKGVNLYIYLQKDPKGKNREAGYPPEKENLNPKYVANAEE
jgi:hypothetical protein